MKTSNIVTTTLCLASLTLVSCSKNSGGVNDATDQDGPMEEAGEWTDNAAKDTAEATENAAEEVGDGLETAAEETEDAFDDAEDQVDDQPVE